jgi:undecaprenyl-phosphate 4-deoxy-4-formamido-L-arabinose transferase
VADLLLDKPKGLYLSTFRCMRAFVADQICRYEGPYPYVDGLILQVTQSLGVMQVAHAERQIGRSGYTFRRLVHLWLNLFLNFSVLPLRISAVLGLVASAAGFLATLVVVAEALFSDTPRGWGSLMGVLLLFCGVQLLTVGLVGEYVGRMYLTANRRPQSVVRSVLRSSPAPKADRAG